MISGEHAAVRYRGGNVRRCKTDMHLLRNTTGYSCYAEADFQDSLKEERRMIENQRIEALEETVETVLRPLVDLLPAERVNSIELTGYDAQLRIATLEARVAVLEQRTAEALQTAMPW